MTCINTILEAIGDKPYLKEESERDVVYEGGGEYKGYEYLITFVRQHRCGYVAIPKGHKIDKLDPDDYMDWDVNITVHGGLTFAARESVTKDYFNIKCDDMWLGFDAMHTDDFPDFAYSEKYEVDSNAHKEWYYGCCGTVKSYEYMEKECKNLIDQLIEINNSCTKTYSEQ